VPVRLRNEALRAFRDAIDRALSCVTGLPIIARQRRSSDVAVFEFETPGEFVPLRGPLRLGLRVRLRAQIGPVDASARAWQASIVAYQYALLDSDGREPLAYHWHPDSVSHVTEPHLHLGPAAQVGVPVLVAAHLPTGAVGLPAALRLAVDAFSTRPLRRDWSATLATTGPALATTLA